jgi:hypothetical protein
MNTYQKVLFHTACKAISEELQDKRKFHQIIRQEGERFWLENYKEENDEYKSLRIDVLSSTIALIVLMGFAGLITLLLLI